MTDQDHFLLQRVQPAMVGLIDGSLSTLAPIFSVAIVSHKPLYAFAAGLATSIGAAISMAFSEGLSDTRDRSAPSPAAGRSWEGSCTRCRSSGTTTPAHWSPPPSSSASSWSRWRGSATGSSGRAS